MPTSVGLPSDDDSQYLPAAAKNYDEALRINPDYGRGLVGQANVLYLEAVLDDTQIDLVKLDQADELLTQALSLEGQPESANIPAKAHFQRGQIYLVRYGENVPVPAGEADWIAQAKDEFTFVVDKYEAGDATLYSLASHAYFRLGRCAFYRDVKDPRKPSLSSKRLSPCLRFFIRPNTRLGWGICTNISERKKTPFKPMRMRLPSQSRTAMQRAP